MKRYLFSLLCISLLFSCSDPLMVESVIPEHLQGKWVNTSTTASQDTVLNFFSSGRYDYTISRKIDSLKRDTTYWEKGDWNVTFVDYNHNKAYDNDSEENHLYTNADGSNVPANIGRGTYSKFKYMKMTGREYLDLYADTDVSIASFVKSIGGVQ